MDLSPVPAQNPSSKLGLTSAVCPPAPQQPSTCVGIAQDTKRAVAGFIAFACVLGVLFFRPLADLVVYAVNSSLYSHIILVPFVSGYLIWLKRAELIPQPARSFFPGFSLFVVGVFVLVAYWFSLRQGWRPDHNDYLSITILAFVMFLFAGSFIFFGWRMLKPFAFAIAFLLFIIPFPTIAIHWLESFFQYASAEAAAILFSFSGTPVLRSELLFQLPGITLEVAEECSGIRSSLVLFITSVLAGYMFLKNPGSRALLAFAVIPLGIVRNALRILTIAMLCVHVDPGMLDSPLHHKGGPIFFALSLIPFGIFLLLIRKFESRRCRHKRSMTQAAGRVATPLATSRAVLIAWLPR